MQIVNITDKKQLNDFVGSQARSQFLQSCDWGEFQSEMEEKIFRLGAIENGELKAAATLIKKNLFLGKSYLFCPRGPVAENAMIETSLFKEIKNIAPGEGAIFLRFEPTRKMEVGDWQVIKTLDIEPSKTLFLDLAKTEDELMNQMHQKTRYNIRLAEKKGVKIAATGSERFGDFWQLMTQTKERDAFRLHGRNYYEKMLKLEKVKLFLAEYGGRPIAAGIFSFFGDTVSYLHGASANQNREVMAPYLLHWEVMKRAKRDGFKYYDLFGVDENKWPGVTRFKTGFGGDEINFPGTFDLAFDAGWYKIYKMFRKIRRAF